MTAQEQRRQKPTSLMERWAK